MKLKFWEKKEEKVNLKKVVREVFADFSLLLAAVIFGGLIKINSENITAISTEIILLTTLIGLLLASAGLRNLNLK